MSVTTRRMLMMLQWHLRYECLITRSGQTALFLAWCTAMRDDSAQYGILLSYS
jgi:hypothetical protein